VLSLSPKQRDGLRPRGFWIPSGTVPSRLRSLRDRLSVARFSDTFEPAAGHPTPPPSVHLHQHRLLQLQVADVGFVRQIGLGVEPVPIEKASLAIGVNGEVADVEDGQVLEEVVALQGR
jgi:hypothetical protein